MIIPENGPASWSTPADANKHLPEKDEHPDLSSPRESR